MLASVVVTYPGDDVYVLGMLHDPELLHEREAKVLYFDKIF